MAHRSRFGLFAAAVAVLGTLVALPASSAAGTWTTITSPRGPGQTLRIMANFSSGAPTYSLTVAGSTSSDLLPGTDTIDIYCFYRLDTTAAGPLNASPLAINADHTFSGQIGYANGSCVLRAVPSTYTGITAGRNSGYVASFTGPSLFGGGYMGQKNGSGRLIFSRIFSFNTRGVTEVGTPDAWGVLVVAAYDATDHAYEYTYSTIGSYVLGHANVTTASGTPSHSEIKVDKHHAYVPDSLSALASDPATIPQISFTKDWSASTGDYTFRETDPLSWCDGNAYPQSTGTCTVKPTGVKLVRTYVVTGRGTVATMTDRFVSTDGLKHALSLEYSTNLVDAGAGLAGMMLPGRTSFSRPTPDTTITTLPTGAHTLFTTSDMFAIDDGSSHAEQGLTYSAKPQLYFGTSTHFGMSYTRTVRAGGTATFTFAQVSALSLAGTKKLAATAQQALTAHLLITAPANGATPSAQPVTVKGKVTNAVNGLPATVTLTMGSTTKTVAVSPTGTWSTTLHMSAGSHTVKATTKDPGGNVLTAKVTVTHS